MKLEYDCKFNIGDTVYFLRPYNEYEYFCAPQFGKISAIKLNYFKAYDGNIITCSYDISYNHDYDSNRAYRGTCYTENDISEDDIFADEDSFRNAMTQRPFYSDGVTYKY